MKNILGVGLSILVLVLVISNFNCQDSLVQDPACNTPCVEGHACPEGYFTQAPFPSGFDYPQNQAYFDSLLALPRSDSAGHVMRMHAWNIWAGLNQPVNDGTGRVVWQTWTTATQAYKDDKYGNGKPVMQKLKKKSDYPDQNPQINRTPPDYKVPECIQQKYDVGESISDISVDGCRFQFNGDLMIAGVIYDETAYNWIRNKTNPLYLKSTLNRLANSGVKDIPGFPSTSFVLKPMMWPIKKDGFTVLPLWDNLPSSITDNDTTLYAGFENQTLWKRAVAVTNDANASVPDSLRFLYSVYDHKTGLEKKNIYTGIDAVTLNDNFYYWQIGENELAEMGCQDRLILDLCSWWTSGRLFEADDFIALVAMHMFTKEFSDWTMQTAWWHDHPDTSKFASHRPISLDTLAKGPWDKYLMVSTYGQTTTGDVNWPKAYNPYIELGGLHPISTNCRNCHLRAGWTKDSIATNYQAEGGPSPTAKFTKNNPYLFTNVTRTDFQWAVPDRVLPNPTDSDKNKK